MSNGTKTADASTVSLRWILIIAFAALAFFASYRFAIARNSVSAAATGAPLVAAAGGAQLAAPVAGGAGSAAPVAGGGGCCGSGGGGPQTTKAADLVGGVQTVSVDLSSGFYNPNSLELKAGVPAEITFGQGSGCMSQVQSPELGFYEDLTSGPKTVKIAALQPGTYTFTCGMQMVSGTIVVK